MMPVLDMLSFKVPVGYAGRLPGGPLTLMLTLFLIGGLSLFLC